MPIAAFRRFRRKLTPGFFLHACGPGLVFVLASLHGQPSRAQKLHPYEPLMMDPYTTIYVDDGSCSAGKVLRVQGAPRNQRRKKSCVPLQELQGARLTVTPR